MFAMPSNLCCPVVTGEIVINSFSKGLVLFRVFFASLLVFNPAFSISTKSTTGLAFLVLGFLGAFCTAAVFCSSLDACSSTIIILGLCFFVSLTLGFIALSICFLNGLSGDMILKLDSPFIISSLIFNNLFAILYYLNIFITSVYLSEKPKSLFIFAVGPGAKFILELGITNLVDFICFILCFCMIFRISISLYSSGVNGRWGSAS